MTEPTLLRQIVEANKSFLSGNPRYLDPAGEPFVVVSCIDPRLTGFVEPALGLPRHRAIVIRTAGNQFSERTRDEIRSVAAAVYVKKAGEIIVVGHTDCGMAAFSASEAADAFRRAGIPRSAFGDADLRTWFGAFPNIRNNVIGSAEFLMKSGLLPPTVKIHGLILETNLGSIEVVLDGDLVSQGATPPPLEPEPTKEESAESPEIPPHSVVPAQTPQKPAKEPMVVQASDGARGDQAEAIPDSLLATALVMKNFLHQQRHDQKLQRAIADLKTIWHQEKNPSRILAGLANIANAYKNDYPSLRGAFLHLENMAKSGNADKTVIAEIIKRFLD